MHLVVKGVGTKFPGANSRLLATIVASPVLAGELSLMSTIAAGQHVKSHMMVGIFQQRIQLPKTICLNEPFIFEFGVPSASNSLFGVFTTLLSRARGKNALFFFFSRQTVSSPISHVPSFCAVCSELGLVPDHSTGDIVCSECDLILKSHSIDETFKGRTFANDSGRQRP
ncbi:hypothetical protein VIGAN_01262400 [Vigna angularis var. angularis]|uniref:TFIIB-type domain-containing protein n=1 Tax=Vigna angularis var. angularis TaxID=157739 RepID=A0A0S3R2M6_PHAAN|nr:hypothetical protein VIGAN_01262400 [Vigna angularis var. angularis]